MKIKPKIGQRYYWKESNDFDSSLRQEILEIISENYYYKCKVLWSLDLKEIGKECWYSFVYEKDFTLLHNQEKVNE